MVREEANDLFVTAMLENNEIIEEALTEWIDDQQDIYATVNVFKSIRDRDRNCGGLIISIESNDIPAGADNIRFFNGDKQVIMNRVRGEFEKGYIMVFTSKDRFRKYNDTAGIVMFIREIFSLLSNMDGVDGIVINMGGEEVVVDQLTMQLINKFLESDDPNIYEG